ncbi:MAG: DNA gyrase subunit A [Deltaproteobacteria bacterium]|nr:DNA gyrase subunit A [Deltaproteobacteria bacterium]NIS76094.1 DNA gyrase subunit A [Deltaproteobacteria bacterium]
MEPGKNIHSVTIEDEMKRSYLDYAMSVIVGRALPDVRDGLKPVHRRILFAMNELGNDWNKPYKKSARIVGDVIGKFHPHGDTAVYDALVRMVQDFSLRYPLVDGQGNFGSVDGDAPAAMRYTEVRLQKIAGELLRDIEKETVDKVPNYDGSLDEPTVLPARIPNLIVNGATGIAVGMATSIPPHNLSEVIDALVALIANPHIANEEMMQFVRGPDFPTGAIIYGTEGIREAYRTGRGSVTIRARAYMEQAKRGDRVSIIVSEIPYQVNKARLIEKVADLVKNRQIEEISDIRDESDKEGTRIVFELKKDSIPEVVLNKLYKNTQMQTSFGIQFLAIANNQPKTFALKELLSEFILYRKEIVTRRTLFDLEKARGRAHILEGLLIALANLDAVIELIKKSKDPKVARVGLMERFSLSDKQAGAILEMRLQRLTGLERQKIKDEYAEIKKTITTLEAVLADEKVMMKVIADELIEVREMYGDERKSQIIEETEDLGIEDLIVDEEMVVTVSHSDYIKRNPISFYRAQRRGGRGKIGMATRAEDFVSKLFIATMHSYLLFFSDRGRVYWRKVHEIPEASRTAKGRAIVNLLRLQPGENITAVLPVREFEPGNYIIMATERGLIKKTDMMDFSRPRSTGIIAISLRDEDRLIEAAISSGEDEVILSTRRGLSIRFSEKDVRGMGRQATGVKAVNLGKDDIVVSMKIVRGGGTIMTVTELGYGKRTPESDYRKQSRGGKGIITLRVTGKTGHVIGSIFVSDDDNLMLISDKGKIIRIRVNEVRVVGRNTQGVRLMEMEEEDRLKAIDRLAEKEE